MHYGQVPHTYGAVFGVTVWVTGVIIIVSMHLLYCTSFEGYFFVFDVRIPVKSH